MTGSEVELRQATRDDRDALYSIFVEVVEGGDSYAQDKPGTRSDFLAYWLDRGGEQWVAVSDGAVLGGYTLRANHPGRGAHVGTASYLVASAARGRGLGHALGAHSLERARALGFAAIQFNFVVSTNTPAVRLWQRLGFRVVGTLPGAYTHAELGRVDALVMFREL